ESSLIQYITADGTYQLQNGNFGLINHNYYQQDLYKNLFKEVWNKLLERRIVSKSLQEIEQIVMQIQSETSSVMMAMEEGTQQVINQTKLAQESKQSLDNIIEVANHIDMLVRSITNDTGEQRETSRDVAQVMQSVERTAQETSQEAQRAAAALQYLVGVSRNLIISVERFRVESTPE
ncbi:MAG: hypothetical protein ACK5P3_10445, partial [Dolichospermum sp.]